MFHVEHFETKGIVSRATGSRSLALEDLILADDQNRELTGLGGREE